MQTNAKNSDKAAALAVLLTMAAITVAFSICEYKKKLMPAAEARRAKLAREQKAAGKRVSQNLYNSAITFCNEERDKQEGKSFWKGFAKHSPSLYYLFFTRAWKIETARFAKEMKTIGTPGKTKSAKMGMHP